MGSSEGSNSYYHWKDNLFEELQQLNNRILGEGGTPNLQIRKTNIFQTLKWWAIHPNAQAPYTGTTASAGHDLHNVGEIWLDPNTTKIVSTGLGIQIPKRYYGQIAPRSSLAQKGIQIMAGIIDSDYCR